MIALFLSLCMVFYTWIYRNFNQLLYDDNHFVDDDLNIEESDQLNEISKHTSEKNNLLTKIIVYIFLFSLPLYIIPNHYLYYITMKIVSVLCVLRYNNVDNRETQQSFYTGYAVFLIYFCIVTEQNFHTYNSMIYDIFNHFILFLLC
ncbi:MAG: hypothetical protein Terrestrivirus4_12 [Terrestrivirus sp.]|uniref:Uncharacterized protein n=1 Tax=Terrestrivirus sp. TaxID=2487775 RepID=A0A3G4ZNI5_9VIRU|nr:MAG: hypothetical protein Terrestrivirus4_12 [Terrestrivirus sp.]